MFGISSVIKSFTILIIKKQSLPISQTDQIKDAEDSKTRGFEAAEAGLPIGRASSRQQRQTNRKIARCSRMLEDGHIKLSEFLERT
jgi:hypothetical protein